MASVLLAKAVRSANLQWEYQQKPAMATMQPTVSCKVNMLRSPAKYEPKFVSSKGCHTRLGAGNVQNTRLCDNRACNPGAVARQVPALYTEC